MFFYQIRRKDKKNDNCNQNWNKTLLLFHQNYNKKHLLYLPFLYSPRLGREYSTYLIQFPSVRLIFTGIPPLLYLTHSLIGDSVKLEFEYIDIILCFHYTVHTTVALDLLSIDCIDTHKAHDKIECIVEISFLFALVLFASHRIGNTCKEIQLSLSMVLSPFYRQNKMKPPS